MMKLIYITLIFSLVFVGSYAKKATVTLSVTSTKDLQGTVNFEETSDGVIEITGVISGLSEGEHGFHIHESGNLTDGCTSAGAHFNPLKHSHGAPNDIQRHVGDLGNIIANASGIAEIAIFDTVIKLDGDFSIINRAVVVHADKDDLGKGGFEDSKTTGHAGARLGCGVIELVD